ncbi:MAG TPA: hypothetical protein VF173_12510 [Thermoanaerobaculia bacterium]|nr:hypothetical protein [Thermoanaerobaculia bacterium]
MLQVELDIFSGRPNPKWILTPNDERKMVDRIQSDPSLVIPASTRVGGLGYRGYIIEVLKDAETRKGANHSSLPQSFRIGGGNNKDASLWLLDTSEKDNPEVDNHLREITDKAIRNPDKEAVSNVNKGLMMSCANSYLTSSTDFSPWNVAPYISSNNCYDFAGNCRYSSYNFAQPGRHSGYTLTFPPNCSNTTTGIQSDGWFNVCQSANNLSIALVIWPGQDFHFYRVCQNDIWCHKPGNTPARNYDNSNNLIYNPQTCDRGPYTQFCGYWYANNSLIIVS